MEDMVGEKMVITEQNFSDEISKKIFNFRKKYYETGDMKFILNMIVEEYNDTARKIKKVREEFLSEFYLATKDKDIDIIIYGFGFHAHLAMDFLKENGLSKRCLGYCISQKSDSEIVDELGRDVQCIEKYRGGKNRTKF